MASFVNSTTLDWEQYIPAMMFSYNTSYHSTIMTTPFELLFGMKARTPSFPSQDVQRLHYGESYAAERLQILKQARLIAQQHTADKGEEYKAQFDKKAVPHDFKIGDLVLYSEYNFLGKNKKLTPKWLGPATIIETTETNVKIKCANNRIKLLNVSHIKHFVLSKAAEKANVYPEDENFGPTVDPEQKPPSFDFLADAQTRPQTRSLTRLLHEQHSINFVQLDLQSKLSNICEKLYKHDVPFCNLTSDEQLLWSAYDIDDILFFLTGDQNFCPDYTEYYRVCQPKPLPLSLQVVVAPQPQPQPQQGPEPRDRAAIDARNIVADPRARRAKTLANRLIYLHARAHSM